MGHESEREFWSGKAGQAWIDHEAVQDRFLSAVLDRLMAAARLGPGERVLDIGCGTGAATVAAAEAVGPDGRVLGLDIADPFVRRTAERASSLPQVATLRADASDATWPQPAFNAAISRFGVMFFDDPAAAFAHIRTALGPGGRVAFATWNGRASNPYWTLPLDVAARYIPMPDPTPEGEPGPLGLADAEAAVDHLRAAGFSEARAETVEVPLIHDGGAEGLARLMHRIGPAARPLHEAGLSRETRRAVEADLARAFARWETGGQLRLPASIHILTATHG